MTAIAYVGIAGGLAMLAWLGSLYGPVEAVLMPAGAIVGAAVGISAAVSLAGGMSTAALRVDSVTWDAKPHTPSPITRALAAALAA